MSRAPEPATVTERRAVRAILLTVDARLLLIHAREPVTGAMLWLTPGGGIASGEELRSCLRRELREETGLEAGEIGPHVWMREHQFRWNGRWIRQHEDFFLVRTELFEPTMAENPEAGEIASFRGFRWWKLDEITASSDRFVPRRLALFLGRLVTAGPPTEPIDVGA